jgi:hypothetical protein
LENVTNNVVDSALEINCIVDLVQTDCQFVLKTIENIFDEALLRMATMARRAVDQTVAIAMRAILESPAFWPNKSYTETLDLLREVGLLLGQLAFMRNIVDYKREGSMMGNRDAKLVFLSKERDTAASITTNRYRYSVTERVQGSWHFYMNLKRPR